ncbi:acetyltransferase [Flavobacterium psychraquaticum]|uniref:acetyltransferase n=1 Tax=Flavobacterium psychraquaticum TaxID=3103958 RepID=UPI002ACE7150|nr:acetyltransferase [Flavobacterium sp. LB-N7T]
MLIVGAKGFAKEVLEVCYQLQQLEHLVFFDDVNADAPALLYNQFPVLKSIEEVALYFKTIDAAFTIGIGNPSLRKKLVHKFEAIGGIYTSTISPFATIGHFGTTIGAGSNIMTGAIVSNDVTIGKGCLIYFNSVITHDCIIENYVEISPSVKVLGRCKIGRYTQIGSNATVLPDIILGENVIVGAGSVVTKDVPANCLVVGVPAVIKKEVPKLIR